MGLLGKLFGPRNPTAHWRARPELVPELDFDRFTFCGVSFGAPMDSFEMLGPAENAQAILNGGYSYPDLGIRLEGHEGGFDHVALWLHPDGHPYRGRFSRGGLPLELSYETRQDEVERVFGPPTERKVTRWNDLDEVRLTYHFPTVAIAFDFDEEGGLEEVWMSVRDAEEEGSQAD
jgi:hypothetical protein